MIDDVQVFTEKPDKELMFFYAKDKFATLVMFLDGYYKNGVQRQVTCSEGDWLVKGNFKDPVYRMKDEDFDVFFEPVEE